MTDNNLSKLDSLIERLISLREEITNPDCDVVVRCKFGSRINECKIVAVYRDTKGDKEDIGIEIEKI